MIEVNGPGEQTSTPARAPESASPGPSRRFYVCWGLVLLSLLALGAFCRLVAAPVIRTRAVISRCLASRANARQMPAVTVDPELDTMIQEEIEGLGGPNAAASHLALYLRLPGRWTKHREVATWILGRCGQPAFPALMSLVSDADRCVRIQAAKALGQIADPRAIEPLRMLSERDPTEPDGFAANCALRMIVDALSKSLDDKSPTVRLHTVELLGSIGEDAVEELGIACRDDESPAVRLRAVQLLGPIGKRAIWPLEIASRDKDASVRKAAVEALERIRKAQEADKHE